MSVLQAEVYEAFRTLEVPDDKALKAAVALSAALSKSEDEAVKILKTIEDDTSKSFSKRDTDIEATRKDVQSLKVDSAGFKWMGGVMLSMLTALFFKAFFH